jgi:AraC-like DNA-binding protein
MHMDGLDAASAAFEFGYESASQFNRDYNRLFRQPPMRDIRTLRPPGALPMESVSNRQSESRPFANKYDIPWRISAKASDCAMGPVCARASRETPLKSA